MSRDKPDAVGSRQLLANYFRKFDAARASISPESVSRLLIALLEVRDSGNSVFLFGNGGSAATASHAANDWMLGTKLRDPSLRCINLSESTAQITAIANDFSYEVSLSRQLEHLAKAGDVLILISASGSSRNLLEGVAAANSKGVRVFALTGFDGGELAQNESVISVVAKTHHGEYGVSEDLHMCLVHIVKEHLMSVAIAESQE